jgi:catechol 2,3-dioxygenase-like lactoylglutathione lyase family enzyme
MVRLEHANLTVRDIDAMIHFLMVSFPEFRVRHDAMDTDGTRWAHVGTNETYVALQSATQTPAQPWAPYSGTPGVNHLAYEVDDVDALYQRLRKAGYIESTVPNNHPYRKRIYFNDPEGNDWEFIQYLTDEPARRHDYQLPNKPGESPASLDEP